MVRILEEQFQHRNLFIFSLKITRVKMGYNYAVGLLYVLVICVLLVFMAIAFLGLLMCRNYNAEIAGAQAHRWSVRQSLRRIKEFKRTNRSHDSTSTKNVVGNPV